MNSQTLPPPQGPEYTPCGCGHIVPEHRPDAGPCLVCDCAAYRPVDETAVERVARRLAARERLSDEARWGETSPEFRDLYRGAAREVIALAQEPGVEPGGGRAPGFAGRADNGQSARADLLNTFASWLFTTGHGSREAADAILAKHRAEVFREAADALIPHLGTAGEAADGEMHDATILWAAEMLRRVADETEATVSLAATVRPGDRAAAAQPESCAHCGQSISRITGTLAAWWVHDPGGNTVCHPGQAASSPRATPKPAAGARQDGAQSPPPPA